MTQGVQLLIVILFFVQVLEVPKAMMTRSSAPRRCVFLLSSVTSPHGHDEKFSSLSLCSFVLMLQVSQVHNDEKFNFSLLCLFFCSSATSP
jgi:hypothetical protein